MLSALQRGRSEEPRGRDRALAKNVRLGASEIEDGGLGADGGIAPGGTASSVLDLTGPERHILREGAIPTAQLLGPPPLKSG